MAVTQFGFIFIITIGLGTRLYARRHTITVVMVGFFFWGGKLSKTCHCNHWIVTHSVMN